MVELTGISTVKEDSDGDLYVEMNPQLLKQMGWDDQTLLEWEVIGNMAIIRKKENAGNSS